MFSGFVTNKLELGVSELFDEGSNLDPQNPKDRAKIMTIKSVGFDSGVEVIGLTMVG